MPLFAEEDSPTHHLVPSPSRRLLLSFRVFLRASLSLSLSDPPASPGLSLLLPSLPPSLSLCLSPASSGRHWHRRRHRIAKNSRVAIDFHRTPVAVP